MVLPLDVVSLVLELVDQSDLYNMSWTCRRLTVLANRKLWHMPYVATASAFKSFSDALNSPTQLYPYKNWMAGLALHFDPCGTISRILPGVMALRLEIISLEQIHSTDKSFQHFIAAQLDQGLSELYLQKCTSNTVAYTLEALATKDRPYLRTLSLCELYFTDMRLEKFVKRCAALRTLKLEKCAWLSDDSMLTIARHCPRLMTLVVTLPTDFAQSNMITVNTIHALEKHCLDLKQFICGGQTRIKELILAGQNFKFTIVDPSHYV